MGFNSAFKGLNEKRNNIVFEAKEKMRANAPGTSLFAELIFVNL